MEKTNVSSSAKIIKSSANVAPYQLGQFIGNEETNKVANSNGNITLNDSNINGNVDPVLLEVRALASTLTTIQERITNI